MSRKTKNSDKSNFSELWYNPLKAYTKLTQQRAGVGVNVKEIARQFDQQKTEAVIPKVTSIKPVKKLTTLAQQFDTPTTDIPMATNKNMIEQKNKQKRKEALTRLLENKEDIQETSRSNLVQSRTQEFNKKDMKAKTEATLQFKIPPRMKAAIVPDTRDFDNLDTIKSPEEGPKTYVQTLADDYKKISSIDLQYYDNDRWLPINSKTIKSLTKNQSLILLFIEQGLQRKSIKFTGMGTLQTYENDTLTITMKPLESKPNTTFPIIHDFSEFPQCAKTCTLNINKKQDLKPVALEGNLLVSLPEKELHKTVDKLMKHDNKLLKRINESVSSKQKLNSGNPLHYIEKQRLQRKVLTSDELEAIENKLQENAKLIKFKNRVKTKALKYREKYLKNTTDIYRVLFEYNKYKILIWEKQKDQSIKFISTQEPSTKGKKPSKKTSKKTSKK